MDPEVHQAAFSPEQAALLSMEEIEMLVDTFIVLHDIACSGADFRSSTVLTSEEADTLEL